jgi:cation:H+ antiporter
VNDLSLPALLVAFAVAAAVVVAAGVVLARSGDTIAERTGLGGLFIGMLLLAGATSLPELATDISAALAGAPDLAVGDLFGSSMANMAILASIDLLHRGRVWPRVGLGHARLATMPISLTALAVMAIVAPPGIVLGWVGIETVVIVIAYVAAVRWIRRPLGRGRRGHEAVGEIIAPTGWTLRSYRTVKTRTVYIQFTIASIAVLLFAPILALSGQGIAAATGIGETFVGALLLAGSTSLPELVASIAAVRIGAYELAVGNLFGSNAFNMVALLAADLAYLPGPILAAVSPVQALAGLGAILMMAVALAAVIHGEETRIRRLEPDAVLVLVIWASLLGAIYVASGAH